MNSFDRSEVHMLALTMFLEARSEPRIGQIAVADVILNRRNDLDRWKKTIKECVLQPWQFSCYNEMDPQSKLRPEFTDGPNYTKWGEVLELAEFCYLNGPFSNYNHYHTIKVNPPWSQGKMPNAIINNHKFFCL